MKNLLPFQRNLKDRLNKHFAKMDFKPIETKIENKTPAIIYQGLDSNNKIIFSAHVRQTYDGTTLKHFNWLKMTVATEKSIITVRPQIMTSSNPFATQGWIYTNEEELNQCLSEIEKIVANELESWFTD